MYIIYLFHVSRTILVQPVNVLGQKIGVRNLHEIVAGNHGKAFSKVQTCRCG